jgi:hypothetical protein
MGRKIRMNEDRLRRESTLELFEAIVSQLDDPDLVRSRRLLIALGVVVAVVVTAITIWGPLGWQSLLAFSLTFLPGMVIGRRILGRRFVGVRQRRW